MDDIAREEGLNGLFESDVITEERARNWLVRFYSKHRNTPNTKTGIVEEAQADGYGYRNITWLNGIKGRCKSFLSNGLRFSYARQFGHHIDI